MGIQRELGIEEGYSAAMDTVIEAALPEGTVEALKERKRNHTESYNDVIVRELGLREEHED